jgi:hypothetical protein
MRENLSVLLSLALIVSILSSAPMQSDDLSWGISVGEEISYVLERKFVSDTVSEYVEDFAGFLNEIEEGDTIVARCTHLDSILSPVNLSEGVPQANFTLLRESDSQVLLENMQLLAIPVGLWDYETDGMNSSFPGEFEQVNTTEQWGSIISGDFWMGLININMHFEMIYYKSNGALLRMKMIVKMLGLTNVDILLTHMDWFNNPSSTEMTVTGPTIDSLTIIGISAVCIAVLAVVGYRKTRNR